MLYIVCLLVGGGNLYLESPFHISLPAPQWSYIQTHARDLLQIQKEYFITCILIESWVPCICCCSSKITLLKKARHFFQKMFFLKLDWQSIVNINYSPQIQRKLFVAPLYYIQDSGPVFRNISMSEDVRFMFQDKWSMRCSTVR